jgi:hypothetical protein
MKGKGKVKEREAVILISESYGKLDSRRRR